MAFAHFEADDSSLNRGFGSKMTEKEFREWLVNYVDKDRDRRITSHELRDGLKELGFSMTWVKASRAMLHTYFHGNRRINLDTEVDELVKFAEKHWGIIHMNA